MIQKKLTVAAPKIKFDWIALSKRGGDSLLIYGVVGGVEYLLADVDYPGVENADPEKVKELALEVCKQLDYDVEGVVVETAAQKKINRRKQP